MNRIEESAVGIFVSGYTVGPPAEALRDFLLEHGARTVLVALHPLSPDADARHRIWRYDSRGNCEERAVRLPHRVPYTYPLDVLVPAWPEKLDVWFGFNNLMAARGLLARRAGRVTRVGYWCIDFVPDRFGPGVLTRAYDAIDRWCSRKVDLRVELSEAARDGRNERHRLDPGSLAPVHIAPMGAWLDRVPVCSSTAYEQRRVIYLGHLVARQGVGALLDAVALLHERGADVTADIIGRGPIEDELRARAESHGIASHVHFHGFVEDHTEVERILAGASIAVAPYDPAGDTFTRWADPGKLKSYLAAGLPIVLTDVPPNARELADRGAADIVAFRADDIANAIGRLLDAPDVWRARHTAARRVAAEFDWSTILPPVLSGLGIATAPREEER